jgi:hypothetical protein
LHSLPDGAVAAKVHLDGEVWTVVKPWKHQKQYRAAKNASWQEIASGNVPNEHLGYIEALHDRLVEILPVRRVPGSNQSIQWQHVLAWCSRDQNSRYQSYFHWRPDGVGLTLAGQSPALVMKVVLGLLKDASSLERLRQGEQSFRQMEAEVAALERQPADLLAHVKSHLTRWLNAPRDSVFQSTPFFDATSLLARARQQRKSYASQLRLAETQQKQIEEVQRSAVERRAPIAARAAQEENQVAQIEAAIAGNLQEVERLRGEPESLQQLYPKQCAPGNRLFRDCHYVVQRASVLQFERAQDVASRRLWEDQLRSELNGQRANLVALRLEISPLDDEIAAAVEEIRALTIQRIRLEREMQRLDNALEDYELYEDVLAGRAHWPQLSEKRSALADSQVEIQRLRLQVTNELGNSRHRRRELSSEIDSIAKELPGFQWGVFDPERSHPFHIGPPHSTTFGVLETLVGDVTCLLDSLNAGSLHPGFLLHDSPREAEMSEAVLWALLSFVRNRSRGSSVGFQYIVTTSTAAAKAFAPFVRLRLSGKTTRRLLLRMRVGTEERPLSL